MRSAMNSDFTIGFQVIFLKQTLWKLSHWNGNSAHIHQEEIFKRWWRNFIFPEEGAFFNHPKLSVEDCLPSLNKLDLILSTSVIKFFQILHRPHKPLWKLTYNCAVLGKRTLLAALCFDHLIIHFFFLFPHVLFFPEVITFPQDLIDHLLINIP